MNYCSIGLTCLLVVNLSLSTVQSASIDPSVRIGPFTKIGQNVTIKAKSVIGSFVKIESHTVIGEESFVRDFAHISSYSVLGKHVIVGTYAQIGQKCSIGARTQVQQFAKISDNAKIDEDAIIDQFADFHGTYIGKRAYVGQFVLSGPNVNIGESAVVHEVLVLDPNTKVNPTEIVIGTPTSQKFYNQRALKDISSEEANIAKPSGQTISPAFNKYLLNLIEKDMQALRTKCSQSSDFKGRPENLKKIISMYLIQYHGLERFNDYVKGMQNGRLPNDVRKMLEKECHLTVKATKTVLEPAVIEKFIQLLTIDQDAARRYRVVGDQFCQMFNQIQSKQRKILLDGFKCNSN